MSEIDRLNARIDALEAALADLYGRHMPLIDSAAGDAPAEVVTVLLDDAFDHSAFYFCEQLPDGTPFRWMGRHKEAVVPVAISRNRPVRVEIHAVNAVGDALATLKIGCDGVFARTMETENADGATVKSAVFGRTMAFPAGVARIHLALEETTDLTGQGDPRTLGVAISKIAVRTL